MRRLLLFFLLYFLNFHLCFLSLSEKALHDCNIDDWVVKLKFNNNNNKTNHWQFLKYHNYMDRVKRIWYLSPMRAAKVQASLRIRAVSPEPSLLAHTSSESRGTFRQKARSLATLNGWACAVKICHDGMLEDTNSLDGAHMISILCCSQWRPLTFLFLTLLLNMLFSVKTFDLLVSNFVIEYVVLNEDLWPSYF